LNEDIPGINSMTIVTVNQKGVGEYEFIMLEKVDACVAHFIRVNTFSVVCIAKQLFAP